MADEVELKLRIAPEHIRRLKHHPAVQNAQIDKPKTHHLRSIYYDTPQLNLLELGVSLRIRRVFGSWIQTVKCKGKALAGLHERLEFEDVVASNHPDLSLINNKRLRQIFDEEVLQKSLIPIFVTNVRRTEWQLSFDNGDQIELSLDLGKLIIFDKSESISEVELELEKGKKGRLYEFALTLQKNIPLELENKSKAQRGYAYYRLQRPAITIAKSVHLHRDMNVHSALKLIVSECLSQLHGNQDIVLNGNDVEGVHQMRIALRRLRSALSVFKKVINKKSCESIVEELRWISGVLGNARDLDVFITETLPPIFEQLQDKPSLILLDKKAWKAKQSAYTKVRSEISSQRYHLMLFSIWDWLENERWRDNNLVDCTVFDIAKIMLKKRHKELKKQGRRLMHSDPQQYHATRIAAKKLRYVTEFFANLYPEKIHREFLLALKKLLDKMGALNDIFATESLIRHLIGEHPKSTSNEALYLLSGWNACNAMHYKQELENDWNIFASQKLHWD